MYQLDMWAIGTMDPVTNELIITRLVPCGCNGDPADPGWDCVCDLCRCPHCSCPTTTTTTAAATEWCLPPPVVPVSVSMSTSADLQPEEKEDEEEDEDDEDGGGAALTWDEDEDEAVEGGDGNGGVVVVDDDYTLDELDTGLLPLVDDDEFEWEYLGFSDWEEEEEDPLVDDGDDSDQDEVDEDEDGDKADSEDDEGDDDEPRQGLSAVTKAKKNFLEATIDLLLALMEEQLSLIQDAAEQRRADKATLMSTGEAYLDDGRLEYSWDSACELGELSYAIRMFGEGEAVYLV